MQTIPHNLSNQYLKPYQLLSNYTGFSLYNQPQYIQRQKQYKPNYPYKKSNMNFAQKPIPFSNTSASTTLKQSKSASIIGRPIPENSNRYGLIKGRADRGPVLRQQLYQEQVMNIPASIQKVQYIPQLKRYMEYQQRQIRVPIQKYYTDYYQIQHITDYVPRQYEQTVIQMIPQQIIRYRLQYVPVQKKIIHLPRNHLNIDNRNSLISYGKQNDKIQKQNYNQINKNIQKELFNKSDLKIMNQLFIQGTNINININKQQMNRQQQLKRITQSKTNITIINNQSIGYQVSHSQNRTTRSSRKRTNYVTSDGYFPTYQQQLRQIQSMSIKNNNPDYTANNPSRQIQNSYEAGSRVSQYTQSNY